MDIELVIMDWAGTTVDYGCFAPVYAFEKAFKEVGIVPTMEEIRAVAESAQADGFVTSFQEGYEMDLGQGGVNVSGGQKQRLCIARALLKKPKILILDDSTSAVDTATEAKIRECFQTTLKETTKFIIAQRIGSVESADKIIVLDEGMIVGMGTHEELIKTCEAYQEIYYSQRDREKEASA